MLKFELSIYQGGSLILLLSTFWVCIVIRRNIDTQLTIKLSNLVISSYGNLLFAMASIIWASSVSVFGSDLKEQWFENKVINWETLIFIFFCLHCNDLQGFFITLVNNAKNTKNNPGLRCI